MVKSVNKLFAMFMALCCISVLAAGCGKAGREYSKGIGLLEDGEYGKSLEYFERAIKENNENASYYIAYGMALCGLKRYEEAISEFEKAYQDTDNEISRQNNKKLFFGQAVAYYGMDNYEKVSEVCDKALESGQDEDIDHNIKKIKAAAEELAGNKENALEIYSGLLNGSNQDSGTYMARAGLYEKLGDYDSAIKDYKKAVKIDKKCYDAYFAMYNIYNNRGDNYKKDADSVINKVINASAETPEETMQLGRAYYYKKDYGDALSNLKKAVKDGCSEALYYLGMVFMAQKDYQSAASKFREYIDFGGKERLPAACNQAAGCYIQMGDYENAETYIDKGLSYGTTDAERLLYKNRVILYEKDGKYKKAKKAAKWYLKKFPDDAGMEKELVFINTRMETKTLGNN